MDDEDDYNSFYSKFRLAICDKLRKKGDRINYFEEQLLLEDEMLTPTFEDIIVLWCLEKISPHLPIEVDKNYHEQLMGDYSLKDLQEEIFQNIPNLLENLEADQAPFNDDIKIDRALKPVNITGFENIKFFDENGQVLSGDGVQSTMMPVLALVDQTHQIDDVQQQQTDSKQIDFVNIENYMKEEPNIIEAFYCQVCENKYSTRKKLLDHMRIHQPKKIEHSECQTCDKTFETRKALTDHNWRHHKTDHTCQQCGIVFPTQKRLEVHVLSHDNYMCEVCNKTHSTYKELYHHKKSHMDKLKCDRCEKSFRKKSALEEHKLSHLLKDINKPFSCTLCGLSFTQKINLLQHNKNEHNRNGIMERKLKIAEDGYLEIAPKPSIIDASSCNNPNSLDEHKNLHLKTSVIICPICGRSQSNKADLNKHMKIHNNDDPNLSAGNIISHPTSDQNGVVVIQTGDTMIRVLPSVIANENNVDINGTTAKTNPVQVISSSGEYIQYVAQPIINASLIQTKAKLECTHCDKIYYQETDYRYHLLTHGVGNKYECGLCEKYFIVQRQLWTHKKTAHPVESEDLCVLCGQTFVDKIAMSKHIREHNPKNKTCEVCGKSFTNKYILEQHLKRHNAEQQSDELEVRKGLRSLKCDTCQRSFHNDQQIRSHVCKHHACDLCDMKFLKFKNLKCHKLIHEGQAVFSCDQCEALFQSRRRLAEHKRNTHNAKRKYKCDLCPKAFIASRGLYNHKLTHSGEKPFNCNECGATFRQKGALVSHYRLHTKECPFQCSGCMKGFRTLGLLKMHRERLMCGFTQQDLFKNIQDDTSAES